MASSETTAPLNHSGSPNDSQLPSRKRLLNGVTPLHASIHHANGFVPLHRTDKEPNHALPTDSPETGRRKRKKTRAFEVPGPTFVRKISTGALGVSGRGEKLSTIPNIMYAMDKRHAKAPEIEFLHRLLFNSAGTVLRRKSNIRAFSGFVFKSEKERVRVRDKLMRCHLNLLKRVAVLLDVPVKDRKDSKLAHDTPSHHNSEIEKAAEAFLGSDSLASEDMKGDDIRAAEEEVDSHTTNGKFGSPSASSRTNSVTEPGKREGDLPASEEDCDRLKAEKYMSRQRKEESARVSKEETVKAILSFLEMPRIPEGRINLAQRDKEKKRQKRAAEKAKAEKERLKKAEEKRKQLLSKSKERHESDEDGDEDLEFEAKPWIVLARERQERDQKRVRDDSDMEPNIMGNGHS